MEHEVVQRSNRSKLIALLVVGVLLGVLAVAILRPPKRSYDFVTAINPSTMWTEGKDKWVHYYVGGESVSSHVKNAREELIPLGFVEDKTKAPWFCFVKGNVEVVVCNMGEFGFSVIGGTRKLFRCPPAPGGKPSQVLPCVLVKNGLGTEMSSQEFDLKKKLRIR